MIGYADDCEDFCETVKSFGEVRDGVRLLLKENQVSETSFSSDVYQVGEVTLAVYSSLAFSFLVFFSNTI